MAETKENNKFNWLNWKFVVGFTLLVFTLWVSTTLIDVNVAIIAFSRLDLQTLLVIFTLGAISWLLRALRTWLLFSELPLAQAIGISFLHNTANNLAPMRLGELALPALTKWLGQVEFSRGLTSLIWIRLLDFVSLIGISLCIILLPYAGVTMLFILAAFVFLMPLLIRVIAPKTEAIKLPRIFHKARTQLIFESTQTLRLHRIWRLTAIAWLAKLMGMSILLAALSNLSLSSVMATILGAELSSVLPIHGFAGAGSYEAGGVLGATLVGQSMIEGLTLTIQLHVYVLSLTALFGILGSLLLLKRTLNG